MTTTTRIILALVVALAVGFAYRQYDIDRGAEWVVPPSAVAAARSAGRAGVETSPGTVAVLPIRSETADMLPFQWAFAGLAAGALVLAGTRRFQRRVD